MLELIIFIVASIIYFAARYFLDPSYFRLLMGVYITVVLISQFYFNVAFPFSKKEFIISPIDSPKCLRCGFMFLRFCEKRLRNAWCYPHIWDTV